MKILLITFLGFYFNQGYALNVEMEFDVSTNMPGVSFPVILKEKVEVNYENGKDKEIRIAAKNLTTGMEIRDTHMQEMVFKNTKNDQDLLFKITEDGCAKIVAPCNVKGEFVLNGKSKSYDLAFTQEGAKLLAKFDLKLSDYDLEISKMGVSVEDIVPGKIRIQK